MYTLIIRCSIIATILILMAESASSQHLISRTIAYDGVEIDASEVVMWPNLLYITRTDSSITGRWIVEYLKDNNEFEIVQTTSSSGEDLIIDTHVISYNNAYRDKSDFRYHIYKLKIIFIADDETTDCMDLNLVVLPSKPIISDLQFNYTYNWEDDSIWPNGILNMNVHSQKAEKLWLCVSESYTFSPPEMFSNGFLYDVFDGENTTIEYDADWGEYIAIEAVNEYGSIYSDLICSTDYIHDSDVLARIEEIRNIASVDEFEFSSNVPTFKIIGDYIEFNTDIRDPMIYDASGKMVRPFQTDNVINISDLSIGLYILSYYNNSVKYQIKFLKK